MWVWVCVGACCAADEPYIVLQRTNVMSDLVKTISSWQVWADSFTHTHAHTPHTHEHAWQKEGERERDTWRTLGWVSSACQPVSVSVSVAVTVSIAIATTSKGNSRPNHPKYPSSVLPLPTPPPPSLEALLCVHTVHMHAKWERINFWSVLHLKATRQQVPCHAHFHHHLPAIPHSLF